MGIYLGFYRPDPAYAQATATRARAGDTSSDPALRQKVIELTDKLPSSCKLLGAYVTYAGDVLGNPGPPSVMVVETNNPEDVFFITQYYSGYLQFQWMPARSVGATRREREATMAATATPAGVR